jgi:hypothetical protein
MLYKADWTIGSKKLLQIGIKLLCDYKDRFYRCNKTHDLECAEFENTLFGPWKRAVSSLDWSLFIMSMGWYLCLRTTVTTVPFVHPPGNMWARAAMVVMMPLGKLMTRPTELSVSPTSKDIWERVGGIDEGVRILRLSIWDTSTDL